VTAASKRRLTAVAALGCVVCRRPAIIHHVKPRYRRPGDDTHVWRDDRYVLPVCDEHHRNYGVLGVALEAGEDVWMKRHGTQASWLDWVATELGEVAGG
jgi:hypothetical protein